MHLCRSLIIQVVRDLTIRFLLNLIGFFYPVPFRFFLLVRFSFLFGGRRGLRTVPHAAFLWRVRGLARSFALRFRQRGNAVRVVLI